MAIISSSVTAHTPIAPVKEPLPWCHTGRPSVGFNKDAPTTPGTFDTNYLVLVTPGKKVQ